MYAVDIDALALHDPMIGTLLEGRYRLTMCLGSGGMGRVYAAEQVALGRKVAVKIILPELCQNTRVALRFLREARAASAVAHENVIEVYDTGILDDGSAYYVMELLRGEDLACTLGRELRLPWRRVRRMGRQICSALAAVHSRGIVHRDLKPANCFRTVRGSDYDFIKVLDFGIAKILEPDPDLSPHTITRTGEFCGSMPYMAPEQASGGSIDHRADIYAVGVILYHLLSGCPPFSGENPLQILKQILTVEPPPLMDVAPDISIPEEFVAVVERAMHKEPELRFPDVRALEAALSALHGLTGARKRSVAMSAVPANPPPATPVNSLAPTLHRPRRWSTRQRRIALAVTSAWLALAAGTTAAWWTSQPRGLFLGSMIARAQSAGLRARVDAVLRGSSVAAPADEVANKSGGTSTEIVSKRPAKKPAINLAHLVPALIERECLAHLQLKSQRLRIHIDKGAVIEVDDEDPDLRGNHFVLCARTVLGGPQIRASRQSLHKTIQFSRGVTK